MRPCLPAASFLLVASVTSLPAQVELALVPETAVGLPPGEQAVSNREIQRFRLPSGAASAAAALGALPDGVAVAALELDAAGRWLFAVDNWVALPGIGAVSPRDIVRYDGASYALVRDGDAVPALAGARIDALAIDSSDAYLVSFDVSIALTSGGVADDEDVVLWTGAGSLGSAINLTADGLDLDGISQVDGVRWLSFDGTGEWSDGQRFAQEDLVEMAAQPAILRLAQFDPDLASVDVAGIAFLPGLLFVDGFASGGFTKWSNAVP